ncbi:hypothetical protein Moror_15051 [Moniliophthora roreri MCA 2997]|uniref:Uncharacterized protein n=1 Tax=Moniliophthora roreri (strain MCA 2997) TaxID=1381753 RepID=V2WSU4_MONRO|nr:hypothetical protein Moror_15051 [Moniliophthora roreri MCA 2997]
MDHPVDINSDVAFITGAASGNLSLAKELTGKGQSDVGALGPTHQGSSLSCIYLLSALLLPLKWIQPPGKSNLLHYELGKQMFGHIDYFFANARIVEHMWLPGFDSASHTSSESITKPNLKTLDVNLVGQLGSISKAGIVHFMCSTSNFYQDKNITINCICPNATVTKIAPDDFFVPFREQGLLPPMELIIEQYISLLGSNKDNGKAIGIVGREIYGIGQAFGYWR